MRAYLDESYNDQKFFVGAAVAESHQWTKVEAALAKLRSQVADKFSLPRDVEFHAVEMFGGRKEWSPLRGKHREVAEIAEAILRSAQDAGVSYIVRGVDIEALNNRYSIPRHPHSVCLEHTLQRLETHAVFHRQSLGSLEITADDVDLRDELQSQFAGYQTVGTNSWFQDGKLKHLQSPIEFMDSRASAGLQVADVMVYLYRRNAVITEKHPAARRQMRRHMGYIDSQLVKGSGLWTP